MFFSEELLDAELPKEPSHIGVNSAMKIITAVLSNESDDTTASVTADKQSISSVRGLQLSDRLGSKVTSGSVVRKVTALSHESNSPLLCVTDRLGDKIILPVTGSKKSSSLGSDGVTGHKEDRQQNLVPSGNRRSISERCNMTVAQVTPTAVNRTSGFMSINTETEQLGPKTLRMPLEEEETGDKNRVRVNYRSYLLQHLPFPYCI
jgi:hypothetical protein